jgi:hypothetical protein
VRGSVHRGRLRATTTRAAGTLAWPPNKPPAGMSEPGFPPTRTHGHVGTLASVSLLAVREAARASLPAKIANLVWLRTTGNVDTMIDSRVRSDSKSNGRSNAG